MSGGGGVRKATGGGATTFEMTSADTGASLKRPVSVVRAGTSASALSKRDVWTTVGDVNTTPLSVPVPLVQSAKSHVWNGAVNGDSARTSSEREHSFFSMVFRGVRELDYV